MPLNTGSAAGRRTPDVAVIGDGIIGLSTAFELARRGVRVGVFGTERAGVASVAAAGLVAPTIGQLPPAARSFYDASLRLYPALLDSLAEFDDALTLMAGLLVVGDGLGGHAPGAGGQRLTADEARQLEPGVDAQNGALLFPNDGAVDNVRLMRALRRAAERHANIELIMNGPVTAIEVAGGRVVVANESGREAIAAQAVLAAGAWSPQIRDLPRPIPVFPLKGQMLALDACPIRRPVIGHGVYLVPRGNETIVGSTSERTGFDVSTTSDAIEGLRASACAVCPGLGTRGVARAWAGVRPATPDMLPILGPDPDHPELLYATGHSRNGILLAPATAQALAGLAVGAAPVLDVSGFGIARFDVTPEGTNLIRDS